LSAKLQPDGKLVAAGSATVSPTGNGFALFRYNPDGSLDPTFGSGGIVVTPASFNDAAYAVVLQADGKLVAAGFSYADSLGAQVDFALARYNSDGTLDPTFGTGGRLTTPVGAGSAWAQTLVLQPNGKLIAAGFAFPICCASFTFAAARYNSDGSLDPTFGTGGKVVTSAAASSAYGSLLQADEKLVLVGGAFTLARYLDSSCTSGTQPLSGCRTAAKSQLSIKQGKSDSGACQ
jgi:uncharacterized delta-60 repeat protein